MIELKSNRLNFISPKVSDKAMLTIEFQRTLRIPDDENNYPLPPGLGAGGRMEQEIYDDPFDVDDWDLDSGSRCYVHIANSMIWQEITGKQPQSPPPTAKHYSHAGLPWFDYYNDSATPVAGSKVLGKLKSVFQIGQEKGEVPLPENTSVTSENIVEIRKGLKKGQVREGKF